MNDQDFWTEMRADPDSDLPGLAYADWLDEQGDERGLFVRTSVHADRLRADEPGYLLAQAETFRTFQQHGGAWRDGLPDRFACRFHRGMLRPSLSVADTVGSDVLERLPVDGLALRGRDFDPGLLTDDRFSALRWLSLLDCQDEDSHQFSALLTSPHLSQLRTLALRMIVLGSDRICRHVFNGEESQLVHVALRGRDLKRSRWRTITNSSLFRWQLRSFTATGYAGTVTQHRGRSESIERIDLDVRRDVSINGPFVDPQRFPRLTHLGLPTDGDGRRGELAFVSGFESLRELACGPTQIPIPPEVNDAQPIERLSLLWPSDAENVSRALTLLESLSGRVRFLQLDTMPHQRLTEVPPELGHLLGERMRLESLSLRGQLGNIAEVLFSRPDRFRELKQLSLAPSYRSEGVTLQRRIANASFPELEELRFVRVHMESDSDFTTLFRSPTLRRLKLLRVSLRSNQLGHVFLRELSAAGLPNLRVLMFDDLPYLNGMTLPIRSAFPDLIYLAIRNGGTGTNRQHCLNEFGSAYDPEATLCGIGADSTS